MNFLAKATVSSLIKLTLWVLASTALFNKKAAYAWICWGSLYKVFFYWEVRMAGRKANYFLQNESNILTLHNLPLLLECISLVFPCAFFCFKLTFIDLFLLHLAASGISDPGPSIEPGSPAAEAESLHCWNTEEFSLCLFFVLIFIGTKLDRSLSVRPPRPAL